MHLLRKRATCHPAWLPPTFLLPSVSLRSSGHSSPSSFWCPQADERMLWWIIYLGFHWSSGQWKPSLLLFFFCNTVFIKWGFPSSSDSKDSACNTGDPASIPGSGRSPGEGNGKPLQYSGLENPMVRGAWQAALPWVLQSCCQLLQSSAAWHWRQIQGGACPRGADNLGCQLQGWVRAGMRGVA